MANLVLKIKRLSYGPKTRDRVEELREKYSDVMKLKGPRLWEVTERALAEEIKCGGIKPLNVMLDTLDTYLAKCRI